MKIFDFLVHSSIYLALSSAFLVYASCFLLNKDPKFELMLIMFLSVYSIYSFSKITDRKEDEINFPERVSTFKKYEKFIIPSIPISYLIAISLAYLIGGINLVFVVLIFLIFAILYSINWIPKSVSRYSRLKDMYRLKSLFTAFAWTWITVLLPFFYFSVELSPQLLVTSILIFTIIFINAVFFDLKDIKGDNIVGTKTIPIVIGAKNTITMLAVLNTLLGIFLLVSTLNGLMPQLAHIVNLSTIYRYLYIYLYNKVKNVTFLYSVIVDGEFIVIGILAFVGSLIF